MKRFKFDYQEVYDNINDFNNYIMIKFKKYRLIYFYNLIFEIYML